MNESALTSDCPACGRSVPSDGKLCPYCGEHLEPKPVSTTETAPPEPTFDLRASALASGSGTGSIDDARFTPGTMLTDRYRIVGLLGKGGMGEVYRADDLTLRQPVALKFLPEALSKDPKRLERFLHEVRVARHVSHPNVCRVYDIAQLDGQQFISMEYVDGEDLAAVLRRLGRPSPQKALQIARQLCAGLGAAHEKGVLHRDLKPHNVMIDGQGKVRITDFGLAGFVEDLIDKDLHVGTPAYMAPEQLAGRGASIKTDIYALGLVLYEIFTGERAYEGTSRAEIARIQSEGSPTSLSTHVGDIDPVVERVILRCLEREPSQRPSSALAVAAALPGGDPLAAALAAGETPDPAMVAAAGDVGGLRLAIALPCLLFVIAGLAAIGLLNNSVALFRQVPMPLSPDVLAFRASELLKQLGYQEPPADRAYGFRADDEYLRYIEKNDESPDRWSRLRTGRPTAIQFWYRQSPDIMMTEPSEGKVNPWIPPLTQSGMAKVWLETNGRLHYLEIVPPQRVETAIDQNPTPNTDWPLLFELADLEFASFAPAAPEWNPTVACDERAAWVGTVPGRDDTPLRIEAGAFRGKPVYFQTIYPWTRPWRMELQLPDFAESIGGYVFLSLIVGVLIASILFAWHNLKQRRGDRSAAFRLAVAIFLLGTVNWGLRTDHVSQPWPEFFLFLIGTGSNLFFAAWLGVLYIAVEPYVRRIWPQVLISWTRLVQGRVRDPLVGRDILAGVCLGVAVALLKTMNHFLGEWFGHLPPTPRYGELLFGRYLIAQVMQPFFIFLACWNLFILFGFRVLLRRRWLAVIGYFALFTMLTALESSQQYQGWAIFASALLAATYTAIMLVAFLRFGLLAAIGVFLVESVHNNAPITLDFSAWYAGGGLFSMLLILAVAAYGFHTSLAGRPLFKDELLSD